MGMAGVPAAGLEAMRWFVTARCRDPWDCLEETRLHWGSERCWQLWQLGMFHMALSRCASGEQNLGR